MIQTKAIIGTINDILSQLSVQTEKHEGSRSIVKTVEKENKKIQLIEPNFPEDERIADAPSEIAQRTVATRYGVHTNPAATSR